MPSSRKRKYQLTSKPSALNKICVTSLLPKSKLSLFYSLLDDLEYESLTGSAKHIAILFSKTYMDLLIALDCRAVDELDFQTRIIKHQDVEKLQTTLLKYHAALLKEKPTKQEQEPAATAPITQPEQIDEPDLQQQLEELVRNNGY